MGLTDIEIRLLVEAVYLRYGHDFRDYAPASLKRRVPNKPPSSLPRTR